ncbi:MAG TPA: hypothetical protein EYN91_23645 [Candidatus Melainabacteria bacterium]|mgnify:CR=1 FL=1|jgi:hypothetical protein|nr:hypothetical protein [Candidatus Melainabacteria bacterium]HIN66839.1 hypothetical protein [Candidatus Obscuribacterales bacterium]
MKPAPKTEFVFEEKQVFKRHWFRHFSRIAISLIIVALNICMVMSSVDRLLHGGNMPIHMELLSFLFLAFIDVAMLIPMVLEANEVIVTPEYLTLKMLYFKKRLAWSQITEFRQWNFLVYAGVKAGRCFYLINRREIKGFDKLAKIITERVPLIEKRE